MSTLPDHEAGAPGSDTAERILAYLREREDEIVACLTRMVRIESPTDDPEAQARVFDVLEEHLRPLGYHTRRIGGRSSATGGRHLYARSEDHRRGDPLQLLLGHSDTVWPAGIAETWPVVLENGRLSGPGVYDMKGGLAQMLFTLRALRDLELRPPATPVLLIGSDEEIGSPDSSRYVERLARRARRAFVLEPGLGPAGRLKTSRTGTGTYVIGIRGKEAHAGLEPEKGASAIQEMSHVIQALHALNDPERGIKVNVGRVEGGSRPNVVAAESRALVDVRVRTEEDAREIDRAIRALEPRTPGTRLQVERKGGRPPMERTARNAALWEAARAAGERLGLELEECTCGGASDGNNASRHTATLDGVGAVGDGAHARNEHVRADRLAERAALLAMLLMLPE